MRGGIRRKEKKEFGGKEERGKKERRRNFGQKEKEGTECERKTIA